MLQQTVLGFEGCFFFFCMYVLVCYGLSSIYRVGSGKDMKWLLMFTFMEQSASIRCLSILHCPDTCIWFYFYSLCKGFYNLIMQCLYKM